MKVKTVGVVGLDVNGRLLATLIGAYGFPKDSIKFVDVPFDQLLEAGARKNCTQAIFVAPLSPRYSALVRAFFPSTAKSQPHVLEIDAAEAIGLEVKYYESFDMPKGAIRGAPPLPEEETSTLRVPLYLVAKAKMSDDTAAALAKAVMDARRELIAESPLLNQVAAPEDDKNAAITTHPGAKAFFDGSENTWSDKYGDWLF